MTAGIDGNGVVDVSGVNQNILVPRTTVRLTKTFTAAGLSTGVYLRGRHTIDISGTFVGTVQIVRSNDNGITKYPLTLPDGTTLTGYTVPVSIDIDLGEMGAMLYFNCSAFTSGSILCEIR